MDKVAKALPQAKRVMIDGADHVPHISVPEHYLELVHTFISAQSPRVAG